MKKLFLTFAVAIIATTLFGQVNLLHTFNGNVAVQGYITENLDRYVFRTDNTVQIYNPDFSLEKTANITLPSGYTISTITATKHLINNDDKYEFLITATASNYNDMTRYGYAFIVNEDGNVIKEFGYSYLYSISLNQVNGQLRLILLETVYGTPMTYKTYVYSCGGVYTSIADIDESDNLLPYPNPATEFVTLPYELEQGSNAEMRIFNVNGQLIESKNIGSHFDNILLDISNYQSGIYFYEYNGKSNRFIVK